MPDIFDLDTLLAQLVLALGAALALGNGYALLMNRRGVKPKGQEGEELRTGRAWFLLVVGVVIAWWGLGSLVVG